MVPPPQTNPPNLFPGESREGSESADQDAPLDRPRILRADGNADMRLAADLAAMTRLQASEERFHRYFELGLIGMAITSPEKGILEANDRMCEIVGYQPSELLRMTWAEITHPEDLTGDQVSSPEYWRARSTAIPWISGGSRKAAGSSTPRCR